MRKNLFFGIAVIFATLAVSSLLFVRTAGQAEVGLAPARPIVVEAGAP